MINWALEKTGLTLLLRVLQRPTPLHVNAVSENLALSKRQLEFTVVLHSAQPLLMLTKMLLLTKNFFFQITLQECVYWVKLHTSKMKNIL